MIAPTAHPALEDLPVWRLLNLGSCEPVRAQGFAEAVAPSVGRGDVPNTLLVVRTETPFVSLGFHQSYEEEIDPAFLDRHHIPVFRRVEGGGTAYLDSGQLLYYLVYRTAGRSGGGPSDLPRFLAGPLHAARSQGLAAEIRPPSDLTVGGRKISGNSGGDWADAHLIAGDLLGRTDHRAMADLFRLPHPALRSLLRREVRRWLTSWEGETGGPPDWKALTAALIEGFRAAGLFRLEPDRATAEEEHYFRAETVPHHYDRSWRDLPASSTPAGRLRRRIRVAGPHGLLVLDGTARGELSIGIVEGSELREAYLVGPGSTGGLRAIPIGGRIGADFQKEIRKVPGFD